MDATQVASWWLLKMRIKLKEKIHLYSSEASPTSTKFMTSLQCKYCNPEQLKWNYLDRKIFYLLFWAHIRPQDLNTPLQTKPKFRCDCLLHNYRKIPHFPLAHYLPGKFQRSLMLLLQRSYSLKNAGIWTVVTMIIYLAHSNYYFFFFFYKHIQPYLQKSVKDNTQSVHHWYWMHYRKDAWCKLAFLGYG